VAHVRHADSTNDAHTQHTDRLFLCSSSNLALPSDRVDTTEMVEQSARKAAVAGMHAASSLPCLAAGCNGRERDPTDHMDRLGENGCTVVD
jgi:hypothetical protein